jgi:hypothetical protein
MSKGKHELSTGKHGDEEATCATGKEVADGGTKLQNYELYNITQIIK